MPFPKDNKAAAAMPVFSFRMVVFLFCRDFPKIRSGTYSNNTVSKPIAAAGVAAQAQTAAWHDMLIAGRRMQCCSKAHFLTVATVEDSVHRSCTPASWFSMWAAFARRADVATGNIADFSTSVRIPRCMTAVALNKAILEY